MSQIQQGIWAEMEIPGMGEFLKTNTISNVRLKKKFLILDESEKHVMICGSRTSWKNHHVRCEDDVASLQAAA